MTEPLDLEAIEARLAERQTIIGSYPMHQYVDQLREDVGALIAEVRRLRGERDTLRELIDEAIGGVGSGPADALEKAFGLLAAQPPQDPA